MKKIFCLAFLIFSYSFSLLANQEELAGEPLAAYKSGDIWHFVGYDGKELFSPLELTTVQAYSEGMFCVSRTIGDKEKWGFLDSTGQFAIDPQYDMAFPYSEGLAVVYNYNNSEEFPVLYSIIDKNGKKIFHDTLISALKFNEGLAFVMKKDRSSGYINRKGEFVIQFKEVNGEVFSEGFASVSNNSLNSGFINKKGEQVVDFLYESVGKFSQGLANVFKYQKYGYIDTTGEFKIEPKFDYANPFYEDRAFVGYLYHEDFKTRWAIIDTSGNLITDYIFPQKWDFSEGLAAVRDLKAWGFIDKSGTFAIEPKYFYTASFVKGLAWASQNDNDIKGYINKNEEYIVIIPKCDKIIDLRLNNRMY